MATTLDQLNTMRDAIIACIGSGALRVTRSDGTTVEYRTVKDAQLALSTLDELIRQEGGSNSNRVSLAQHKRGDGPKGYGGDRGDWNGGW
jgi:hypothetical protein